MASKVERQHLSFDSSSEDEEENARLREAVEGSSSVMKPPANGAGEKKKSGRRTENPDEEDEYDQLCTPEVRAHLAKKLTAHLDSICKVASSSKQKGHSAAQLQAARAAESHGIRLFAASTPSTAENMREQPEAVRPKPRARPKPSLESSSSDDEEMDRIAMAAVSGDAILKDGGLPVEREPARKSSKNCELEDDDDAAGHEVRSRKHAKRKKHDRPSSGSSEDEGESEKNNSTDKKKKKKKKKKKNKD